MHTRRYHLLIATLSFFLIDLGSPSNTWAQHAAGMQTDQFYEYSGIKTIPDAGADISRSTAPQPAIKSALNAVGEWQSTGNMNAARRDHTSTLLHNGKVLIMDGTSNGTELFDPATGTFKAISNSIFGHGSFATATRLLDGRVLIVGGGGATTSAEIFDPSTETFSATGSLNEPRTAHAATLLTDGKVLISAGQDGIPPVTHAHAELYDPATGLFTLVGSLNEHRSQPTATLLLTGDVLITGGTQTTSPGFGFSLDSAELFDPDTQTFREVGSMSIGRTTHRAAMLHDGKVLITGALGNSTISELYDPDLDAFHLTGESNFGRAGGTATTLLNGQVLFVGGSIATGPITTNTAELFNPQLGTFSVIASMNTPRQQHRATLLTDGRVLVTGGYDGNVNVNSAEVYRDIADDFAEVTGFTLIDAETGRAVPGFDPIPNTATINLRLMPRSLNIRANTEGDVESVLFSFNGNANFHIENVAPYALFGDSGGDYNKGHLPPGIQTLSATPFSEDGAQGDPGTPASVAFNVVRENPDNAFSQFVLVDADTDTDLFVLGDGATLDLSTLPDNLNVRADVTGPVASVRFTLEPQGYNRVENVMPFALFGDTAGDYFGGNLQNGEQTLTATAFKQSGAFGQVGHPVSIALNITNGASKAALAHGSGDLLSEGVPARYALYAAYPNPFNPSTTIRYALPESAQVSLVVYDILGREIEQLVNGIQGAGHHEVSFDGGDLSSAVYLYRLETPQGSFTRQILLHK